MDETKPIEAGAKAAVFTVNLTAGKTRLETWLADEGGESRGAFYAYVKRLEAGGAGGGS